MSDATLFDLCTRCAGSGQVYLEHEDRQIACPACTPHQPFAGDTYEQPRDESRLRAQLGRVKTAMSDGEWHTLYEISAETGDPYQSVSARLRDLRKAKFGGHQVHRRYQGDGVYEYRLENVGHTADDPGRPGPQDPAGHNHEPEEGDR